MRVLLIEDDVHAASAIELVLRCGGFSVFVTDKGEEGLGLARRNGYDVVLLDHHLPDISGLQVIRALRAAGIDVPIVVLSGDASVGVRVDALRAGADDYLTKPFHRDELIARLMTVVRRCRAHSRSIIAVGQLTIDLDAKTASAAGIALGLTTREYEVLATLCLRKGMTLSKDMLIDQLYGGVDEPDTKIIDVYVCKLRKKIAAATKGKHYIHTVWGRGYQVSEHSGRSLAA